MVVKHFTGPTLQDALSQMREDLGAQAVVAHMTSIRQPGFLGFFLFWRRWIEIVAVQMETASTDSTEAGESTESAPRSGDFRLSQPLVAPPSQDAGLAPGCLDTEPAEVEKRLKLLASQVQDLQRRVDILETEPQLQVQPETTPPPALRSTDPDRTETAPDRSGPAGPSASSLQSVRPSPAALSDTGEEPVPMPPGVVRGGNGSTREGPQPRSVDARHGTMPSGGISGLRDLRHVDRVIKFLADAEISETLRSDVRQHLLQILDSADLLDLRTIRRRVHRYVKQRLNVTPGLELVPGRKGQVVALVGTTGTGKTTTLAKLAAQLTYKDQLDVAMVTIDCFRMGAIDQIKNLGEIMKVSAEVALRPEDMVRIISRLGDRDVILVDTVGRNARRPGDLQDLKEYLDIGIPVETHLVLPAAMKLSDMKGVVSDFHCLGFSRIVMTKVDETYSYGAMLSFLAESDVGVSYVTTGQEVPEDIELADAGALADLLFGGGFPVHSDTGAGEDVVVPTHLDTGLPELARPGPSHLV